MKKIFLFCVMALMFAFTSCDQQPGPIEGDQLPKTSQNFIKDYFPDCKVHYAERDRDDLGISYEVYLSCAVKLEFDKSGEWTEVDCKPNQVPDGIIPKNILAYVHEKYDGYFIVKIDKDYRGYDVELNTGLDLEFDTKGEFIRVDM